MKTKAISPLISYILLIGMVVATSVIVSTYLIKQSESVNFQSKEIEIYCSDVAVDAVVQCKREIIPNSNNYALKLNLTNRGYYNVSDFSIVRKQATNLKNLIPGSEFNYILYKPDNTPDPSTSLNPIPPSKRGLMEIGIDQSKNLEITLTPSINIDNKLALCNEKVFKLEMSQSDIITLNIC